VLGETPPSYAQVYALVRGLPSGLLTLAHEGGVPIAMDQLWKIFHNCSYRRSVVMERSRRAEPSPPTFCTPISLHNHGPASRATERPRYFGPALEPIETGLDGLEPEPHERRRRLGSGHEPGGSLPWPPGSTAELWKLISGSDWSEWSISQRLAVAMEQPSLHNY
jgi:hypothetical protein